ncbi:alpha/beta hydrolase family protein [Brevibacterium litoralis]|uniref:alpha/beta hydrolase family protein n=1 Tax=Brevibacterium litoralis TaxID=3138935 RepID=UPI0032EB7530
MSTAPYGSWASPLSAARVAAGTEPVHDARFVGDEIWFLARSNAQNGRSVLFRTAPPALLTGASARPEPSAVNGFFLAPVPVLPAGYNIRSRVHEYGGGAWTVLVEGDLAHLFFVEGADQRLHHVRVPLLTGPQAPTTPRVPVPITPATDGRVHHGDLVAAGDGILAVQETDLPTGRTERAIIHVTLHPQVSAGLPHPPAPEAPAPAAPAPSPTPDPSPTPADSPFPADPDAPMSTDGHTRVPRGPHTPHRTTVLTHGPHFLAWPRLSPDRSMLAFIGWDHPDMPWDTTGLYVQRLTTAPDPAGTAPAETGAQGASAADPDPLAPVGSPLQVFGMPEESVLQPEWVSNSRLTVLADRSGTWDLYRLHVPDFLARARGEAGVWAEEELLFRRDGHETGGPLWTVGARWYSPVRHGTRFVLESRRGTSSLVWTLPSTTHDHAEGQTVDVPTPLTTFSLEDVSDGPGPGWFAAGAGTALLIGGSGERVSGLYTVDLATGVTEPVHLSIAQLPEAEYFPRCEVREFEGPEGPVHALVYPPHNPGFTAADGEAPPYVAFVHGGPTGQAVPQVSLHHAYFTSRGIGVVDVNYGGSTGYGRAYRNRLRGQWGIVDVEDTLAVLEGLAAEGSADRARLSVSGGSAGGWTVLRALTTSDVPACGTSYFGVAELARFVTETHDFESHYIDSLVGPRDDPGTAAVLSERAPVNHLDDLRVPVAVFQGGLDPIVPPAQARRLIAALEDHGLPYTSLFFPDESHGFVRPDNVARALEAELGFYGRVLGFATPGVPPVRMRGRGR